MALRDIKFFLLLSTFLLLALAYLPMFELLAWALGTLPHEWGHTLAAWGTGRWAAPNFFFTAVPSTERQLWWVEGQLLCCAGVFVGGLSAKSNTRMLLPLAWSTLLLIGAFTLRHNTQEQLILWGGQGGELILTTGMIVAGFVYADTIPWVESHYRALLFWGAIVFLSSVRRWFLSLSDPTKIPFGAFGESGDEGEASNGDIDRLIDQFQWTLDELSRSFLRTAVCCILLIAIAIAVAWFTRSEE